MNAHGMRNQHAHANHTVLPLLPSATCTPALQTHVLFFLTVGLGHTFQLVLLLDSIRVAASLGGVDQLFCKALGNRLDVAEGSFAGTSCEEGDGLVDSPEGRHVDGLATDGTSRTNSGRVFARAAVHDGIDGNLDGVLVCHEVNLSHVVSMLPLATSRA